MKRFREFLAEMPYAVISNLRFDKSRKPLKLESPSANSKKVSSVGDYHIYKGNIGDEHAYYAVHKDSGATHMRVLGHEDGNKFTVTGLMGHNDTKIKAHEFYHHLITHHGIELHSDRKQSKGGKNVWKKLSKYKDIQMGHRDSKGNELKVDKKKWDNNYSADALDPRTYSRLIARKK